MKILSKDGREKDLNKEALDGLRLRLKGPILLPGDSGYEESRTVWNAMINKKPVFVVKCVGTADVIECVNFARQNDILLCIKGGGHNIAGLAIADGAMLLDMSLMRGVWVDRERKIAHARGCFCGWRSSAI